MDQCKTFKPCYRGRCRTGPYGGYSCTCSAGWTGQNCIVDVDECSVATSGGMAVCHLGATCVNTPGSFSCNWIPGYTGIIIIIVINWIILSSCEHNLI